MNADDDVWTPALKLAGNVPNGAPVEEFAPFGPKAIDGPIKVFHPGLFVAKDPVIDRNQSGGDVMGFFDGADRPNSVRLAFHKTLNAGDDGRSRRTMSASGIGGDDQNFRNVGIHN